MGSNYLETSGKVVFVFMLVRVLRSRFMEEFENFKRQM